MAGAVMLLEDLGSPFITPTTKALKDEIEYLKAIVARQAEEIATLKVAQESQVEDLKYTLRLLNEDVKDLRKGHTTTSKDKALAQIEKLYQIMKEKKVEEATIDQAAFLLKISKRRMNQLKELVGEDSRFDLGWSRAKTMRGQKGVVIKIHQYIK